MPGRSVSEASERLKYAFLLSFAIVLLVLAVFETGGLLKGSYIILSSPANLLTDYLRWPAWARRS